MFLKHHLYMYLFRAAIAFLPRKEGKQKPWHVGLNEEAIKQWLLNNAQTAWKQEGENEETDMSKDN